MKIKKIISAVIAAALIGTSLGACSSGGGTDTNDTGTTQAAVQNNDDNSAADAANNADGNADSSDGNADTGLEPITIKGLADVTPHNELIEFVKPKLEEQGITVEIVSTLSDTTWNPKVQSGEVDFNFMQHDPYLIEWNEQNDGNLVNVGVVHIEPIAAYSERYTDVSEIPDGATVVVPDDATNEYRALKILEDAGFIKLGDIENLRASVQDIEEYIKPLDIVEMDAYQINVHTSEFDIYINNTNKVIEAGLDASKFLFREGSDSPYANIIVTTPDKVDNRGIKALVEALQSPETASFILEKYNGAVIPVFPAE